MENKFKSYEIIRGYSHSIHALTTECDSLEECLELTNQAYENGNNTDEHKLYAKQGIENTIFINKVKPLVDYENFLYLIIGASSFNVYDDTYVKIVELQEREF